MCCEEDLCDTLRTKNIMSFPGSSCTWQERPGNEKGTSNKLQVPLARTLQLQSLPCLTTNILVLILLPWQSTRQKISYDLSCVATSNMRFHWLFSLLLHMQHCVYNRLESVSGESWDIVYIGSCKKSYSKVSQWKLVMVTSYMIEADISLSPE